MKLSPGERQIMIYQAKILQKLSDDKDEVRELDDQIEILQRGYALDYDYCFPAFSIDEMSDEDCLEVRDILTMFCNMRLSFDDLKDKEGITEESILFPGFDGNHEPTYLAYAKFFLKNNGQPAYKEMWRNGEPVFNSHTRMLSRYRVMYEKYRQVDVVGSAFGSMSAEAIKAVLDA